MHILEKLSYDIYDEVFAIFAISSASFGNVWPVAEQKFNRNNPMKSKMKLYLMTLQIIYIYNNYKSNLFG